VNEPQDGGRMFHSKWRHAASIVKRTPVNKELRCFTRNRFEWSAARAAHVQRHTGCACCLVFLVSANGAAF